MIIPKLHYISQGNTSKEILENIQKACTSGAELVVLRYPEASEKKYLKLAKEVIKITTHYQTRLIITDFYKLAKDIKADGVLLEASEASVTFVRKHLHAWQSIGGYANTLADCEQLLDHQINYIYLGPFKNSDTENNTKTALGLSGYTAITDVLKTPTPILAYGGVSLADVTPLLNTEISGIAASDAITQNFDSIKLFNQLLNASSTQEQRHTFE